MKIENIINEISTNLSIIIYQVKLKNKANLNDINTLLETPFKDILNIIYDYDLVNLNNKYLYPAVDLGDKNKQITFQVTSERSIKKIKQTLKKFKDNNLDKEYRRLKFLVIDEKIKYSPKNNIDTTYFSLKDDVYSCFELINIIKNLELVKQEQINNILRCVIGIKDNISLDVVFENKNNIPKVEKEYTEKIALTKEILTNTNLPLELRKCFNVEAKIVGEELKYVLNPKVENAYELHPMQEKFKMKFNSPKEKEDFIKNGGVNNLIREATIQRRPIEIPYVSEVREYIGKYENPFSDCNYAKDGDIKLYILPKELPKGEKYKIIISDGIEKFCIKSTALQVVDVQKKHIIFNNFEAKEECFDITLKINILEEHRDIDNSFIKYNANINITLREKYKYSCKENLEIQKFLFTINSCNSKVSVQHIKENKEYFVMRNLGNKNYNENDYQVFKNYKRLLQKIIYIEKKFNIKIKYNLDYFYQNEFEINLIYYDSQNKNYKLKDNIKASFYIDDYDERKYKNIVTDLSKDIDLFNYRFSLKSTKILLANCEFYERKVVDGKNIITLVSKDAKYIPKWNGA